MQNKRRLNAYAWLSLVTAVAAHVFDEAMNDFLPFYNQTVTEIREVVGFGPPTARLWISNFGFWILDFGFPTHPR